MNESGSTHTELSRAHELARASGLVISPEMFAVVMELLKLDVTPNGIVALLRALKDQRLKEALAMADK